MSNNHCLVIRGARTHNLKDVSLNLPRDRFICITGPSGSGKSSLAFDTLFAEGQRRYVESLSTYARQFLSVMPKPDVDAIEGLSPAIAIQQRHATSNPRSTVGTQTEILDYLRLLYARLGTPCCPTHDTPLRAVTISQIIEALQGWPQGIGVMVLAPLPASTGDAASLIQQIAARGYVRLRIGTQILDISDLPGSAPLPHGPLAVVVDRFRLRADSQERLAAALGSAAELSGGMVEIAAMEQEDSATFATVAACPDCGYVAPVLEPRMFSFNSPEGACPGCDGLGVSASVQGERLVQRQLSLAEGAIRVLEWFPAEARHVEMLAKRLSFSLRTPFAELPPAVQHLLLHGSDLPVLPSGEHGALRPYPGLVAEVARRWREAESPLLRAMLSRYVVESPCAQCAGTRLNERARHVVFEGHTLPALCALAIAALTGFFSGLSLQGQRLGIADPILREIGARLGFLLEVGLGYLSLARATETLSGGEAQRIRLASQIGSGLTGVLYVLDEPSIGLHPRDTARLIATLHRLRDLGNTLVVVEHDEETMRAADHLVDMGPGAGVHGGTVVASGTVAEVMASGSLTGDYLSGRRSIPMPAKRRLATAHLRLHGLHAHNLKHIDVTIPLGAMVCITGVSGSGKSSLVRDTLLPFLGAVLAGEETSILPLSHAAGFETIARVLPIDQEPIGRTPRSNPATYTGAMTVIRDLFSQVPEARARGYGPGRFSFNVAGGRCQACQGEGEIRVAMHFLPDVFVPCDICQGRRYNAETLQIHYKGKSIWEVLGMTVDEACTFFGAIAPLRRRLDTLKQVGLSYLQLGQSATTLSGGEAQRLKLARELAKPATRHTMYILDEPTTGLHLQDIAHLLDILERLVNQGHSVVVIEHHLDVIKCADWLIDMGPEGGDAGGRVVACGTPEEVAQVTTSHTGQALRRLFQARPGEAPLSHDPGRTTA